MRQKIDLLTWKNNFRRHGAAAPPQHTLLFCSRSHMVKEVASKEEFDKILSESGDNLIVIDYTATWCG